MCSVLFPFWFGGGLWFAARRRIGFWDTLRRSAGRGRPPVPFGTLGRALVEYVRPSYVPGKPEDDELLQAARRWYSDTQSSSVPAEVFAS